MNFIIFIKDFYDIYLWIISPVRLKSYSSAASVFITKLKYEFLYYYMVVYIKREKLLIVLGFFFFFPIVRGLLKEKNKMTFY
ncbi:hypothetical protein CISIN_1g034865mg [Citrus sinensis]|uniref:Uncharacterized protein n=1 Tax=Citrus sinensis TaxID=2711 RepID=A0A067F9L5_CITSI|nr:hypothetical protein CISIN_1g034865mg [Citrus sinensis]